jgi:putative membrane protein
MHMIEQLSESKLSVIIYALTLTVVALVAFMIGNPGVLSLGTVDVSYAPKFHAFINGTTAVLLTVGYTLARRKSYNAHRMVMLSALGLSIVFLLSYVVYHSQQLEPVRFAGEGVARSVYYFILVTHIVLASVIVPLALFTIARSWRGEFAQHRKLARITFPLWLYVAVTGVVVYYMLYVWYPQA